MAQYTILGDRIDYRMSDWACQKQCFTLWLFRRKCALCKGTGGSKFPNSVHKSLFDGYHQTSYTSRTLVGNKLVDHPDVVGASPVDAAPTTSSFST